MSPAVISGRGPAFWSTRHITSPQKRMLPPLELSLPAKFQQLCRVKVVGLTNYAQMVAHLCFSFMLANPVTMLKYSS